MGFEDDELAQLFSRLASHKRIVVGVSGGGDSMALMYLLKRWQDFRPRAGAELIVLTVDHGLRAASGDEALWVKERAISLGLEHRILCWLGKKPNSGIQDAARVARYGLMVNAARDTGCTALVVAHHMEDQAETFFMRLARGSGLDGLVGMVPVIDLDGLELHRPLLGTPKLRLQAELKAAGHDWLEDPSNENSDFERVRVRNALGQVEHLGIDAGSVARSAERLGRARRALEETTCAALSNIVEFNGGAFGRINIDQYFGLPEEIRLRVLGEVISVFGGRRRRPQMGKLENICAGLESAHDAGRRYVGSLGGTLVRSGSTTIDLFREPARGDIIELALVPGGGAVMWDGRFLVTSTASAPAGILIGALGDEGIAEIKSLGLKSLGLDPLGLDPPGLIPLGLNLVDIPRDALLALPALRQNGRLVGIPHVKLDEVFFKNNMEYVSDQQIEIIFVEPAMCQSETKR